MKASFWPPFDPEISRIMFRWKAADAEAADVSAATAANAAVARTLAYVLFRLMSLSPVVPSTR